MCPKPISFAKAKHWLDDHAPHPMVANGLGPCAWSHRWICLPCALRMRVRLMRHHRRPADVHPFRSSHGRFGTRPLQKIETLIGFNLLKSRIPVRSSAFGFIENGFLPLFLYIIFPKMTLLCDMVFEKMPLFLYMRSEYLPLLCAKLRNGWKEKPWSDWKNGSIQTTANHS